MDSTVRIIPTNDNISDILFSFQFVIMFIFPNHICLCVHKEDAIACMGMSDIFFLCIKKDYH